MKNMTILFLVCAVLLQSFCVPAYAGNVRGGERISTGDERISAGDERITPGGIPYDEIGTQIDKYVKEREEGLVSCEVAVFCGDETLYENYYGYADVENKVPADENTVYEWASCSKILVWTSVMQLAEDGKLDLNEDIRTYLPEGFLKKIQYKDVPITMLHLMSHTAGWQESVYENQEAKEKQLEDLETTLHKTEPYQAYRPGEYTAYSNYGTALAAFIVQRISGMDYADYVHENILKPLRMEHTAVSAHRTDNMWVREQREKLHTYIISQDYYEHFGTGTAWVQLYPAGAAAGTLSDFLKFAKAFTGEKCPLFDKAETRELMFTATSFYGESGIAKNCHGFWTAEYNVQTVGHGGNSNCSSMIQFDPVSGLGIVIMTNEAGETAFNYGLPALLFGSFKDSERIKEYIKTDEKPDTDKNYSGVYISKRGYPHGFVKIMGYTGGILPLQKTEDENRYKASFFGMDTGIEVVRIADGMWLQTDGNGMEVFLYESTDSDGNVKFEMMSQDMVPDKIFAWKFAVIVIFYLLGFACIIILAVKLVIAVVRKAKKKEKVPSKADKNILAGQAVFAVSAVICLIVNFMTKTVYRPFAVISCILAVLTAVGALANGAILIRAVMKEKDIKMRMKVSSLFWAFSSVFYAAFIYIFDFYNFWQC